MPAPLKTGAVSIFNVRSISESRMKLSATAWLEIIDKTTAKVRAARVRRVKLRGNRSERAVKLISSGPWFGLPSRGHSPIMALTQTDAAGLSVVAVQSACHKDRLI